MDLMDRDIRLGTLLKRFNGVGISGAEIFELIKHR